MREKERERENMKFRMQDVGAWEKLKRKGRKFNQNTLNSCTKFLIRINNNQTYEIFHLRKMA